MFHLDVVLLWFVILVGVGFWATLTFWSREARMERRRRKSHSRLVTKTSRPMVRFSVRLPKRKKRD